MRKAFLLFILLIVLGGCTNTNLSKEQEFQEDPVPIIQKTVEVQDSVKKMSLVDLQQAVCSFVKNCAYTEKITAGKMNEIPENQLLKYYETVGGPFLIIEGEIGDFEQFVQNQAKLRFDKLKKSIKPTDFQAESFYFVEKYDDNAYLYKYKVLKYYTTSKVTNEKMFLEPTYGARFFVKCSDYVVEVFPDVFGGKVKDWSGLNENDYDATIENGIQFQINNMKPKVDGLISLCNK